MRKSTVVGLALIAIILVGTTIVIPAMRRSARRMEHDSLVTRPFQSVRNGATRVSIMNTELLHALSEDQRCIENLTEITFSSVTFDGDDQLPLKKLKNVTTLGFYCCENVDYAIPAASELSLNLLWFEIADITPEALKIIRRSKSIKAIGFEQQLSEPQVRILQSFPDTIKIKSSFPLNAYD